MESQYEKEIADEWGPANAVTHYQICSMFKMARLCKNDVLYDLGSGHGRVVRLAVTEGHVKRAIGIEQHAERFCRARMLAKKRLTKRQLTKVDFWLEQIGDSDLTGVTIVYHGHDPSDDDAKEYSLLFRKRRVRIIRKDLPLVGYAPIASSRDSSTTWFFLMSYPLKEHRVRSKDGWAKTILGPKATIDDVFKYYDRQLKRRDILDRAALVRELKRLVRKAFRK